MEEYVQRETERALKNGKVYDREITTYGKIWYDEDVHYLRLFETEFPAIVYIDALTSKSYFSPEPTVSPQHVDEINLKNETSLSEYDGCKDPFSLSGPSSGIRALRNSEQEEQTIKNFAPKTAEEVVAREIERKARTTLLMAIPEDHLAKFHKMTNAKEIWNAIKSRFGGKRCNSKVQKSLSLNDVKGLPASSSNFQIVAFVSENSSSTNDVSNASWCFLYCWSLFKAWWNKHHHIPLLAVKSRFSSTGHDDLDQGILQEECQNKGRYTEGWMDGNMEINMGAELERKEESKNWISPKREQLSDASVEINAYKIKGLKKVEATVSWPSTGYGGNLSYENEVSQSVFKCNKSDSENPPLHKRLAKTCEMQAVPPPMTGNYLPSGPDIEIEDSQYTYGLRKSQPSESESQTTELDTCDSNISTEPSELVSEPVVNKSNVEVQPKVWSDAPIIEEYESDSDDECVTVKIEGLDTPSFANKQVKTPRENVKNQSTNSQKPKVNHKELGHGITQRGCFVCGSISHLIRDCDYHVKLAKQVELNKQNISKGNGTGVRKQTWNNVQRVNKQNQFVPLAVQTRTGTNPVNAAKASSTNNFSTARQSVNRQTVLTSTALKVNTVQPMMSDVRSANVSHKTNSPSSRPFKRTTVLKTNLSNQKVYTSKVKEVSTVGEKWVIAVKSSASCKWRIPGYNNDIHSKYNGGSSLRNYSSFKDPLGQTQSPNRHWSHKRANHFFKLCAG
ncbi:hypothetical protein Tco_0655332 [Tanacetum coccineum]|uniref:CCHC-type domain-containing protein n=1 Tax=Tanacetum coccineum TaxID=301880 RepID=A0ABQ4X688_9ASTR